MASPHVHHHHAIIVFNTKALTLLFVLFSFIIAFASPSSSSLDSDSLLKFKDSFQNNSALFPTWNATTSPCSADDQANWEGVLCSQGMIWGLKLENMGLKGTIDVDSLKTLPYLRTISLMNNNFDGPLPDIRQVGSLKTIYLSNNKFSGVIDSDIFLKTMSLKKVHLAYNQFTGGIPASLAFLPKLKELRLEGNQFEGLIPNFPLKTWLSFNVSNNALGGQIPLGLSNLDATSFNGNQDLCGPPLKPCSHQKSSVLSIVVVAIVVLMALSAICAVILILNRRMKTSTSAEDPTQPRTEQADQESLSPPRGSLTASSSAATKKGENTKLAFVRDDREKFDMQDLLRASAEVLGSGSFGSSYKAALLKGTVTVVKRFKQMNNVGREEFQQHMRRIGRLRHPNVLPLVAYYYKKEEKLLVSDYVQNGSLAVHLHGGQGVVSLNWRTRLEIIKGVARGLNYLQTELPTLIAAHGHLKSSNVLLNDSYEPLLSDYALIPVMNQEHAQQLMVAYKSPEHLQHGRITKKTDVWSLGILILEILTRKPPDYEDLVRWVSAKAAQEEEEEVFDSELLKAGLMTSGGGEREMLVKLLQIGMECCNVDVENRLDMKEATDKIEELKDRDDDDDDNNNKRRSSSATTNRVDDDDFYSIYASDIMEMRSSGGLSDEFINFNVKA